MAAAAISQADSPAYKELRLSRPLSAKDKAALAEFNRGFDGGDLRLTPAPGGVSIALREVDIRRLRAAAKSLSANGGGEILTEVVRAIEEIKSYGLKGGRRRYVGYNAERKVKNRIGKEKARGKLYYAADFDAAVNPPPSSLVNKIICGDALDALRRLPDSCVDLIFTSPPYNFGLDYKTDDGDEAKWEKYFADLFAVFGECIRVVKRGGRIAVNVQPLYSDYIPSHHLIGNFFISQGMIWRGEILWEKNNYNCKYTAWGSWKSPSNPYLKYSWEFIEVFCKGDLKKEGEMKNADIGADEFKKWVYGKWSLAPARGDQYGHPAMFPEALAERIIKLFSFRGDLVVDPFNGAGTTCAVAKKTGRRYLGIDISKEYCATARKRLAVILL